MTTVIWNGMEVTGSRKFRRCDRISSVVCTKAYGHSRWGRTRFKALVLGHDHIPDASSCNYCRGVLHLMMIGPYLKPSNFPMELLLYTDILFIVAGLAQIFWALPMMWGIEICYNYAARLASAQSFVKY